MQDKEKQQTKNQEEVEITEDKAETTLENEPIMNFDPKEDLMHIPSTI